MTTRRHVLKGGAALSVGTVYYGSLFGLFTGVPSSAEAAERIDILADGLVVSNPNLCVGCRRCEIGCCYNHEGDVSPTLARVKVEKNMNFGPYGVQPNYHDARGQVGDRVIIPATCNQCDICKDICREDAIYVDPNTKARVVDHDKCVGCNKCVHACPKGVISVDPQMKRAVKCDLCDGKPMCAKMCPTGAIRFYTLAEARAAVELHETFLR